MDALFYRDTIQKKLLALGLVTLKTQVEPRDGESDNNYLDRVIAWVGDHFGGYSISHVNGPVSGGKDANDAGRRRHTGTWRALSD